MELRRTRMCCCVEAPPELQWSFAGAIGAALELRWSSAEVAMELRRSIVAALELHRAAMEFGQSCDGARWTPSVLRWSNTRGCTWRYIVSVGLRCCVVLLWSSGAQYADREIIQLICSNALVQYAQSGLVHCSHLGSIAIACATPDAASDGSVLVACISLWWRTAWPGPCAGRNGAAHV